jgi:DNA-binding LacI/PurR family transcriptional regulator
MVEFKAIADRSITAWICANDEIAIPALNYLSSCKIKVPDEIAVIGFDNHPFAFEAGLSSFDFDIPNIIRQALGFITYPNRTTGL